MSRISQICITILLLSLLSACKTKKPLRPMEEYSDFKPQASTVHIPITVGIDAIEQLINAQLEEVLYEDENTMSDGLAIKAKRTEDVQIDMTGNEFMYNIPVLIEASQKTAFGKVGGDGEIKLFFKTKYEITKDWQLKTETSLDDYEWFQKPVLKMGPVKIPVRAVADRVIERSKTQITTNIDEQLKKGFDLKSTAQKLWLQVQDPILVEANYKAWASIQPQEISLTPLVNENDTLKSTIRIKALSSVDIGEKPIVEQIDSLPDFQFKKQKEEEFNIYLTTTVPYDEVERYAKQFLIGETFEQGNQSVRIEDLFLYGRKDKIVVDTKLSGSYNGNVYLEGMPVYNEKTNVLEVENLEFELGTQSVLFKTAGWLFKKNIEKQIKKSLRFPLEEHIQLAKSTISDKMRNYQLAPNVFLNGNMENLEITQTALRREGIKVVVLSKGS